MVIANTKATIIVPQSGLIGLITSSPQAPFGLDQQVR